MTNETFALILQALDWCPFQRNLLASGGGTADRHIRFWNPATGICVNSIDTKSQVTCKKLDLISQLPLGPWNNLFNVVTTV